MRFFKDEEFLCTCNRRECNASSTIDEELGRRLDILRESVDKPIKITSALRCAWKNQQVGGAPDSMHLQGKAADILITSGIERYNFERHIFCRPIPLFGGIGHAGAHIHVDLRSIQTTWIESGT